jgi:hypothetical protein
MKEDNAPRNYSVSEKAVFSTLRTWNDKNRGIFCNCYRTRKPLSKRRPVKCQSNDLLHVLNTWCSVTKLVKLSLSSRLTLSRSQPQCCLRTVTALMWRKIRRRQRPCRRLATIHTYFFEETFVQTNNKDSKSVLVIWITVLYRETFKTNCIEINGPTHACTTCKDELHIVWNLLCKGEDCTLYGII